MAGRSIIRVTATEPIAPQSNAPAVIALVSGSARSHRPGNGVQHARPSGAEFPQPLLILAARSRAISMRTDTGSFMHRASATMARSESTLRVANAGSVHWGRLAAPDGGRRRADFLISAKLAEGPHRNDPRSQWIPRALTPCKEPVVPLFSVGAFAGSIPFGRTGAAGVRAATRCRSRAVVSGRDKVPSGAAHPPPSCQQ